MAKSDGHGGVHVPIMKSALQSTTARSYCWQKALIHELEITDAGNDHAPQV